MWTSRNKIDLMIEVWEKLDCESVGRSEIEAVAIAVEAQYGKAAVESPMIIARLLADEGAQLRHSEIMELYVERASDRPYDAAFRGLLRFDDLSAGLSTIRQLQALRSQYQSTNDKEGVRLVRVAALEGREILASGSTETVEIRSEIDEWIRIWLETPSLFEAWLDVRMASPDFVARFGSITKAR